MLLYIVRHGETDWNQERRMQGEHDTPLNKNGKELARITARALEDVPFDLAISSPLSRALETARILIGDRKIPVLRDSRIREINWGEWDGIGVRDPKPRANSAPFRRRYCRAACNSEKRKNRAIKIYERNPKRYESKKNCGGRRTGGSFRGYLCNRGKNRCGSASREYRDPAKGI